MNSTTIAVGVAKTVCEVAVSEHPGQVRERQRFSRDRFHRYLGEQPPAAILMEACGSAHYWGRQAQTHGPRVVLLPPHVVRPLRPRQQDRPQGRQGPAGGRAQ
jgi:transposase